jgi:FG-GAP repeat
VERSSSCRALAAIAVTLGLAIALLGHSVGTAARAARGVAGAAAARRLESLPVGAQSVISSTLGSGEKAFAARRAGAGWRLVGGGVAADLGARGVSLRAGGGSVSMALAGVGRSGRFGSVGAASLRAGGDRVVFDRGGLREWYAARPLGIEQGFSLSRRPAGVGGAVGLEISLEGSLRARQTPSGVRFLTRSGRVALRYGGVQALDASGRRLPAFLALRGRRLLLGVLDRRARYPLRIDPMIQQGSKLTGSGERSASEFGYSVALSSDGNTALIGGPGDNSGIGTAWVFTRSGSVWTQQGARLIGLSETGTGEFGYSVALSSEGDTALIGGPRRQRQRRGGVGVRALGRKLEPAGREADRLGRDRHRLVRLQRGAVIRR